MGKIIIAYDWIVLEFSKKPYELICNRCKQKQVMPGGSVPINIFIDIGEGFEKIHKHCKKKVV